jgi:hypothetical protein
MTVKKLKFTLKGQHWCPYCLRQMKALHGDEAPVHGDIGICRACGHTMVINSWARGNKLCKPRDTDWQWIEASAEYQALLVRLSA